MSSRQAKLEAFGRLLDIMDELREKCPWDHKQTTESLRPQTIEETYELSDAILRGDDKEVSKELGDVLLHIVFYAKIGSEKGEFDIVDVINRLCDKLIYRHPHVFGEVHVDGADQVVQNWEELKTKEKDGNKRVLSGVPVSLPPLLKAYRMQDKARAVGFDWDERSQVWDKVAEELGEFRAELDRMDKADSESVKRAEGELGDFLFSVVNAARLYDLNPDTALEMTCAKFRRRFTYLEEHTIRQGRSLKERTALLLGDEALDRLRLSTVVVAGLGGVGAYAAEMTARAGVGRMILIDSDKVSESNKNRQLLALDSTVGQSKTDVMAARLLDINPDLRIVKVPEYLTEDNVADVLDRAMKEMFSVAGVVPNGDDMEQVEVCNGLLNRDSAGTALRPDFVIDAIDTLSPKIALIAHCVHSGIPLVSSMGSGAKLDATKVRLTDISKSYNCPLAFIVFSEELPEREAIVPTEGERNKKSQVGTVSYLPAVFGCVCAQAAVRHLCGK